MGTKHFLELDTDYDVERLVSSAKKRLNKSLLMIGLYFVIFVVLVLTVIFWGSYIPVFVIGIIADCVFAFLISKQLKTIEFSSFKTSRGEIVNILKESTTDRSITGGYGMYVTREYDAFAKAAIRLTVSIKNNDKIHSYTLNGVTEEHVDYYEAGGEAIHIWGTRFPVKLEIDTDKWLCPACGEFNANEEKSCVRCKMKILK